jgi:hypothetical protein
MNAPELLWVTQETEIIQWGRAGRHSHNGAANLPV